MSNFGNSAQGFGGGLASGGGGGGTVTTDNLTILGDGSVGSPLIATSSLTQEIVNSGGTYTLDFSGDTRPRLLFVVVDNVDIQFTSGIYSNTFLRVQNLCPTDRIDLSGGSIVYFDGTDIPVTYIPLAMTYDFVYRNDNSTWYCVNHFPNPTQTRDSDTSITLTYPAFYKITDVGAFSNITLDFPSPTVCAGQRLIIWAQTTNPINIGTNQPIEPDTTPISVLASGQTSEFICLDDEWIMISQR